MSGELKKLEIAGFVEEDGGDAVKGGAFSVQINPANISLDLSLQYQSEESVDNAADKPKFKKSPSQTLNFEFTLDGTGAIPGAIDIDKKIELLKTNVYYYCGTLHEPPYVLVKWGEKSVVKYDKKDLRVRLSSLKIDYTLFDSSGKPLRAKVSLSFLSTIPKDVAVAILKKESPDLTHIISVRAGDNLPQMCKKIYGDPLYYTQIAEINGLTSFRCLEPGMDLIFPPLK